MFKVLYLAGGYPTKDNPSHGVFNQRAAEALRHWVKLTVVQYRIYKPGRKILEKIHEEGFDRLVLCIPFIPFFEQQLYWVNNFIFREVTRYLLNKELKESDIVHASDGNLSVFAAQLKDSYKYKLLAQFIGGDLNQDLPRHRKTLVRIGWKERIDSVIFNSLNLQKAYQSLFSNHRFEKVIYRGVNAEKFRPPDNKEKFPVKFYFIGGLPNYRTFSYGRNTKGGITLMNAWQIFERRNPDSKAELHFAGPDSDIGLVESWQNSLICPEKVIIHGSIKGAEISTFHQKHDVILVPSLEEGLPNAAMEASASGNMVIASDVGGIPEVIENGSTGILVAPGDAEQLADAMERIIQQPDLIENYGTLGRERMQFHFNSEEFGKKYHEIYKQLMH